MISLVLLGGSGAVKTEKDEGGTGKRAAREDYNGETEQ